MEVLWLCLKLLYNENFETINTEFDQHIPGKQDEALQPFGRP